MAGIKPAEADQPALTQGIANAPSTASEITGVAHFRYQLFRNSLRTLHGNVELFSRAVITLFYLIGGLGAGFGLGSAAWYFTFLHREESLAFLLWPIFFFWQLFPIMSTTYAESLDSSTLLRFTLTYSAIAVVRLVYGSL